MDLFEQARQERIEEEAPLAARMRPRNLDEFVGQDEIVGPGRLLRRAIQADQLSSLIFYGPPGTGKTTLAQVIANSTAGHFSALNAVLAGVKEIRAEVKDAQERMALYAQRTILFVDEVHRFNKAQQDALLPWVENGTVIFVGATTENPYFEVNKALVSRSRIFQLKPLTEDHLRQIVRQALSDSERGYGGLDVTLADEALDHWVRIANGDARALLNALELAVETTPVDADGQIEIDLAIAEESIQRRAVLYDKEGDYHFDTISAFIKSLRGSDPDASLYWLAKMVYAGEDPRFIFRRMLIFAGEDVGMADPNAICVVEACAAAFDRIGMPEGQFPLSQSAIYLATAQKSNSTLAFFDALETIRNEPEGEVPNHLRDGNRDREGFGHGAGYLYPHAYREHWVAQQYLPSSLQGKVFYDPSEQGYEREIGERVTRRREAQLAAMVEDPPAPPEILTNSPADSARDRWLQRTISRSGQALARVRDRLLAAGSLERHDRVLDLNAGSGLLLWEALRRVPEGGVFALAQSEADFEALSEQQKALDLVTRPHLFHGRLADLSRLLDSHETGLRFEAIVGRNALIQSAEKGETLAGIVELLTPGGWLAIAERIPARATRIYSLVDQDTLSPDLLERWRQAEEAIYADPSDPMVNWDDKSIRDEIEESMGDWIEGQKRGWFSLEEEITRVQITPPLVARWFGNRTDERASYMSRLTAYLSEDEIAKVRRLIERDLLNRTVDWRALTLYIELQKKE